MGMDDGSLVTCWAADMSGEGDAAEEAIDGCSGEPLSDDADAEEECEEYDDGDDVNDDGDSSDDDGEFSSMALWLGVGSPRNG